MNRFTRVVLVAGVLLVSALAGAPARAGAGNWAVTYLDPLPARFQPDRGYTIGYWVLQHGDHPYSGPEADMRTALRLTGPQGRRLEFAGLALREKAHYAAAIAVPRGVWRVEGIQGPFEPFEVGTLTVPGAMRFNDPGRIPRSDFWRDEWDVIRPPLDREGRFVGYGVPPAGAPAAAPGPARASAGGAGLTPYAVAGIAALALLVLAGAAVRLRPRLARRR
ncbi:hypothetical protein [Bailinhaonella thermotolerans]|uniref:Uncharacterized protein n=1 Tax=Bailinhaonella thermotolerans TaxID=1070861 RepID=A0A3A4B951_9ACTN|nr:hypothetical protein [Bailinhaonella thermotolerans]RJL34214.1 hypothetical protein D5H75_07020 [Bailinhaonella thermotolerans]